MGTFGLASADPLDLSLTSQPSCSSSPASSDARSAVLPGQCDEVGRQPFFVITASRYLVLRRAMLSDRLTNVDCSDGHYARMPVLIRGSLRPTGLLHVAVVLS